MKTKRARLDADRKAKPRTRLVGHARTGECVGPGTVQADALEDVETGKRTPLLSKEDFMGVPRPEPRGRRDVYGMQVHTLWQDVLQDEENHKMVREMHSAMEVVMHELMHVRFKLSQLNKKSQNLVNLPLRKVQTRIVINCELLVPGSTQKEAEETVVGFNQKQTLEAIASATTNIIDIEIV